MSIGENIRRLREREGLSQTAFAGRLGVTKETVGRWESGRTFPRRTHLDKMIADFAVCADDIMSEERGLGTAPSAPTADNWPGPETRNDDTGAAEGAGDAILPVYKTDRSGNGTTLRHTGYACAPSDVAARHVASIFVRMDYREMTRLYPVGSLLLVDQRARPYNGCTVVALVDNATIVVRRYTAGNNTVVLSSWPVRCTLARPHPRQAPSAHHRRGGLLPGQPRHGSALSRLSDSTQSPPCARSALCQFRRKRHGDALFPGATR